MMTRQQFIRLVRLALQALVNLREGYRVLPVADQTRVDSVISLPDAVVYDDENPIEEALDE